MIERIQHVYSETDLSLTTTAIIDGRDVRISTEWSTEERAEDNYTIAQQQHEQRLRKIESDGVAKVATARNATVRRLLTIAGHDVSIGRMRGQVFDTSMLNLGGRVWRAPIDEQTGRTTWRAWHRSTDRSETRNIYGIGFRTWAAYLAVEPVTTRQD